MAMLIFSMSVSVDGFIADRDGRFGWSVPSEEQFRFHLQEVRELGAHLCGRRLYETMLPWETDPSMRATEPEAAFDRLAEVVAGEVAHQQLGLQAGPMSRPALGEPGAAGDGQPRAVAGEFTPSTPIVVSAPALRPMSAGLSSSCWKPTTASDAGTAAAGPAGHATASSSPRVATTFSMPRC